MVSSQNKKALYAIGGYYDDGSTNDIYKFHCPGDINTCRWTKSETTLRFGRSDFVAIPIPYSLADKLCSTDRTTPATTTTTHPCNYNYEWIGDGLCDDETNFVECGYDGGDCCGDDVKTNYCNACICHSTNPTTVDPTNPTTANKINQIVFILIKVKFF